MPYIRTKAREAGAPIEAVQWTGSNLAEIAEIMGFTPYISGDLLQIDMMSYTGPGTWIARDFDQRWIAIGSVRFTRDYEEVPSDV